ncbi:MAG: Wzz/FepE/Etk N-terminal domain-containing protein [Clostridia bacterium]
MEELDIKELLYILMKNIGVIIVVAILSAALGLLYTSFMVTPMYKSSTSLVLSKSGNTTINTTTNPTGAITQNDLILNQKLVSTYGEIIKSRAVVSEVISRLGLNIKQEELMKNIAVSPKKDTELLEITVSYKNAKTAVEIADTLAEVFKGKVKEVYNIENVSVIDKANLNDDPYNVSMVKTSALFAIVGVVLVCMILFIKMYFNNTVNTQEDIEKLINLPVLSIVPKCED